MLHTSYAINANDIVLYFSEKKMFTRPFKFFFLYVTSKIVTTDWQLCYIKIPWCMILSFCSLFSIFVHTSYIRCFQDVSRIERVPMSTLPIICFRDGSPPLPDALNTSLKDSAILGRRLRKHIRYKIVATSLYTCVGHVFFMLDTMRTAIVILYNIL